MLRLAPLSVDATATLCARQMGAPVEPDFAAACHEATGGNPFFLEALLREAVERRLPAGSGEAVRVQRIAPLGRDRCGSPPTIGCIGRGGLARARGGGAGRWRQRRRGSGHGRALTERGWPPPPTSWSPSTSSGRPTRLEFAHPIVREAVRADIGPTRAGQRPRPWRPGPRSDAARRTNGSPPRSSRQSRPVTPSGSSSCAASPGTRSPAAHPPLPSRGSGGRWRSRHRPNPEPTVLVELGSAELRLGAREAVAHLTEAVELSQEPEQLATAARRLAIALTIAGDADRAVTVLERAIDVVEPSIGSSRCCSKGRSGRMRCRPGSRPAPGRRGGWSGTPRCSTGRRRASGWSSPASPSHARGPARRRARPPPASNGVLADGRFVATSGPASSASGSPSTALGLIVADAFDLADAYIGADARERPSAQAAIPASPT